MGVGVIVFDRGGGCGPGCECECAYGVCVSVF